MRHFRKTPPTELERQLQAEVDSWKAHCAELHSIKLELAGLIGLVQQWQAIAGSLAAWKRDSEADVYKTVAEELQLEVAKLQAASNLEEKENGTQQK